MFGENSNIKHYFRRLEPKIFAFEKSISGSLLSHVIVLLDFVILFSDTFAKSERTMVEIKEKTI